MKKSAASDERVECRSFGAILAIQAVWIVTQDARVSFLLAGLYFITLLMRGYRFSFPRIAGLVPFLLMVVLYGLLGFLLHPLRYVVRDLYYILPSFLWLLIGHMLATNEDASAGRSMFKTLYIYGLLVSLYCFAIFPFEGSFSFNGIRQIFVIGVYDVGIILAIAAYQLFVKRRYYFSRGRDGAIIAVMILHVALSLGRISIIEPLLFLSVLLVLVLANEGLGRSSSRIMAFITAVSVAAIAAILLMPESASSVLVDKIGNTFSEVNSAQSFDTNQEAMDNWRGYEIHAAWQQWSKAPFAVQLFGAFLGQGVHIALVPYSWEAMVVDNEIPILHNGYLTLLPKMGLLGVGLFILIYLSLLVKGLRLTKRGGDYREIGYLLVAVTITSIVVTYVIRGPITEEAYFAGFIVAGWLVGRASRLEGRSTRSSNTPRQTNQRFARKRRAED